MALFQPTNIIPSSFSGEGSGTVAVDDDVNISWQINGYSALYGFRIYIYQNTSASQLVYSSSSTITAGCPAYGTDAKGNPTRFEYAPSGVTWRDWGLTNGNSYKLKIRQYTSSSSYTDQISDAIFITRHAPSLTIFPFSTPVRTIEQTVTATFGQPNGDTINWVRWQFYYVAQNDAETLIDDTGRINTGRLEYTCGGLISGNRYKIACSGGTSSGVIAVAEPVYFNVLYDRAEAGGARVGCENDGAVVIHLSAKSDIPAVASESGGYSVSGGTLTLNDGVTLTWDEVSGSDMDFGTRYTLVWNGDISRTDNKNILSVSSGNVLIKAENGKVVFLSDLTQIDTISIPNNATSATITLTYNRFKITFNNANYSHTVTYTQQRIHNVVLYGAQTCRQLTITNRNGAVIFNPLFITSANAGGAGDSDYGAAIYRTENDDANASKVYTLSGGQTALKDYGIANGTKFEYTVFDISSDSTYSAASVSGTFCATTEAYWLLEAKEDENDPSVYHVVSAFKFGANIADGAISNNNQPKFLTNFTPYEYRQPSSVSGKSGTLQALIGNVIDGEYTEDTAERMAQIFALSTSKNTLFLKDLKGNIYMVHTSAPITQTINIKQKLQSVTVSVPWKEIGDASGISLIQTATDEGWSIKGANDVGNVTGEVTVETSELYFAYPSNYFGSEFGLYQGTLTARTPEDASQATFEYDAPYLYATVDDE